MANAYHLLVERFQKIYRLQHLGAIASWDQAAIMPSGGNQARADALAELSSLTHELLTDTAVEQWLGEASQSEADVLIQGSIREMKRTWMAASVLPSALVKAKSLATSKCEHAWRSQRPDNNWPDFAKNLKEVLKLSQEEAQIRASATGQKPYDSLMNLFEPGMTTEQLDALFGDLKTWLPSYIQEAVEKQKSVSMLSSEGHYDQDKQKALGLDVMNLLGFDFNHGRLDISTHPFCGGVSEDVRMTTRYSENNFVDALMATVHETGHARYQQNLPADLVQLPVGSWRSMGIHESQSLFFEMQLGRSPEFLELIRPLMVKHLANGGASEVFAKDNLLKIYREVRPGYIRVEADEITYPAHVVLRYDLEKALISGDLLVDDLPQAWDEKMQQYLGLSTKGNFKDGCMQDIHWPMGMFGYFPSYTLGAMYAAQQFASVKQQLPDVRENISKGELTPIFDWLKENIWHKGCTLETNDLMTEATGEPLNIRFFQQHLKERYLA